MKRTLRLLLEHLRSGFDALSWYTGYLRGVGARSWAALGRFWRGPRGRFLLRGVPAALVGAGGVALTAAALTHHDNLTERYETALRDGLRQQDFTLARVAGQRLTALDGGRLDSRFSLALAYQGLGDTDHAAAIMSKIRLQSAAMECVP